MAKNWLDTPYNLAHKRLWIAGHTGMVGTALMRQCETLGCEILTATRAELDLRDQSATCDWIKTHKPGTIIIAAATVGGILANDTYPADFLYDNLMIATNILHAAHQAGVEKLLFLGSSCIYPKHAPQPITEESLLSGPLEPTNEAYAIAKIAALKLCQAYRKQYGVDFISAMPCNLYGPGDRFDARNAHVIPALMMKAYHAKMRGEKRLTIWGTGTPRREFLHVDDLAAALIFLLQNYSGPAPINIGSGEDITIADLAKMIAQVTGFDGEFIFDPSRPDGTPRKLMDSSKIKQAGWRPQINLQDGLRQTYEWYQSHTEKRNAA